MQKLSPTVRAIMPIVYRGSQGKSVGIPLFLEQHVYGYSYTLPGGILQPGDSSTRSRLQFELFKQHEIKVKYEDIIPLYVSQGAREHHLFYIKEVEVVKGRGFKLDPKKYRGIGMYGVGTEIPFDLKADHLRLLDDNFLIRFGHILQPTPGLTIPKGYFDENFRKEVIPDEIISWNMQHPQWPEWEAIMHAHRGFPALNKR